MLSSITITLISLYSLLCQLNYFSSFIYYILKCQNKLLMRAFRHLMEFSYISRSGLAAWIISQELLK